MKRARRRWGFEAFVIALVMIAASMAVSAQMTVDVPFKFEAGGKSFPSGQYSIEIKADGSVELRPLPAGAATVIAAKERQKQGARPVTQPEIVFDKVGNFEPSFSEYVTDYLLSEVWLPGADGVVVLTTTGRHDHQTVQGRSSATGR
jgi:hypothetical protein